MMRSNHLSGKLAYCALLPVLAVSLSSALSSCSKEAEPESPETLTEISGGVSGNDVLSGTHIITAQAPPGSKMTLSSSGRNLLWAEGDRINLFDGDGAASGKGTGWTKYRRYDCNEVQDGGAVAKFISNSTPVTSGKSVYYAHYPEYDGCDILYGSGYIHSWITWNQSAKYNADNTGKPGEGVLPANRGYATPNTLMNVAVAKSTAADGPYSFKNIHSLLRFTVPSSEAGVINRFKLAAYSDEETDNYTAFSNTDYLCGDLLIDYNGDIPDVKLMYDAYSTAGDHTSRQRTPECSLWAGAKGNDSDVFAAGDYRMAIRPCSIKNGLHLWFTTTESDAQGNTNKTYDYVRASFGRKTFARNTPYYMGEVRRPAATTKAAGAAGITFPYVMSFRTDGTDRGQQYVTVGDYVTNYSDDTVTQEVTDPSTGATLTAVGCHKNVEVVATTCYVHSDNAGRDYYSRHCYACSFDRSNADEVMRKEAGMRFTFPLAEDAPSRMNLFFGLEGGEYACKYWRVLYTTDPDGFWCKAGDVSLSSDGKYEEFCVPFCPPASMAAHLKAGNVLHIKIVPVKTETAGGHNATDPNLTTIGHGRELTHVNLFSCVALTDATKGSTDSPSGEIVHFVPFDDNVGGLDYRCDWDADRNRGVLGSFTNFDGGEQSLSGWTCTNVRVRPGYAQIGYVDSNGTDPASWTCATGSLTSPALAVGAYDLSFKAMAYETNARGTSADYASKDRTSIRLTLTDGVFMTYTGNAFVETSSTIDLSDIPTDDFGQYRLCFKARSAAATISFTSPDGSFTRWFIDDICLRKISAGHEDYNDGGSFW